MKIKNKYIKTIIIILTIILIIFLASLKYYLYKHKTDNIEKNKQIKIETPKKEVTKENTKISVDIKGAVKNPGVYQIEEEKRVIDVVIMSGGLTEEADTTYINLAKKIKDEMVIIIYTKDQIKKAQSKETLAPKEINNTCICPKITNEACIKEETTQTKENKQDTNTEKQDTNKKVNINTATEEELQTITGIGESKAKAIISYREEQGPFKSIEDIKNVSGIGESLYEKVKNSITV